MNKNKISFELVNMLVSHNVGVNDVELIDQHEWVLSNNCSLDSVKLAILGEYSYMLDNNVEEDMTDKSIQGDIYKFVKVMESVKLAKTIKEMEEVCNDLLWCFREK